MYIYGGMDKGGISQQLWAYNFTTSLWKEVQLKVYKNECFTEILISTYLFYEYFYRIYIIWKTISYILTNIHEIPVTLK